MTAPNPTGPDLNGRRVLVTGANRGLGAALVDVALSRGAEVVFAAARRPETIEVTGDRTDRVIPVPLDVTHPESILAAAESVDIDLVISNAGVTCQRPILSTESITEFRETMEVNYFGTLNLVRAFADQVRAADGGFLFILSVASIALSRSAPAYSASKAATLMLASALREETRDDGVGVTVSLPGWIDTDMAAALPGEKASPRDVATRSILGHLNGEEVVWPDRFALLVKDQVRDHSLELLTSPRSVMNDIAARFSGGAR